MPEKKQKASTNHWLPQINPISPLISPISPTNEFQDAKTKRNVHSIGLVIEKKVNIDGNKRFPYVIDVFQFAVGIDYVHDVYLYWKKQYIFYHFIQSICISLIYSQPNNLKKLGINLAINVDSYPNSFFVFVY